MSKALYEVWMMDTDGTLDGIETTRVDGMSKALRSIEGWAFTEPYPNGTALEPVWAMICDVEASV